MTDGCFLLTTLNQDCVAAFCWLVSNCIKVRLHHMWTVTPSVFRQELLPPQIMQFGSPVHASQAPSVILGFMFSNSHSHSVLCNWSWSSKRLKMEKQMSPNQVKVGGKKWSCVCVSLYLLHTWHQNTHSTSNARTFWLLHKLKLLF